MIITYSAFVLSLFWLLPTASIASSESEKWSWPTSAQQEPVRANNRRDIYYENVNGGEKSGRIRVPTSYYDNNRRPLLQQYQVKEPTTASASNRPSKPLSDEFSGENFGESGNNLNGFYQNNNNRFPNRFGQQQQVAGDFPGQFGGQQFYPGSQFGAGGGFPHQGAFGGQQFPFQGNFGGGYPGYQGGHSHSPSNGILVGPGGPTGIFGRPYGGGRYPGGGLGGGLGGGFGGGGYYPQQHQQFGGFNQFQGAPFGAGGFDGGQNGIGPYYGGGGINGINPYNQGGFGGNPQYGFGGQQPFFDSTSKNASGSGTKKVEKSAK